ncbi:MAG: hypothetical protein L0L53_11490 [Tetragenococcus halophilus]|nr:hypothetical protein [Tetragenococcus halophilus]
MYRNHAVIHGIVIGEVYGLKPVFEDTKELNFHIEQMDINKDKLAYVKNVLKAKDFWMEELAHSAGVDIVTTNENKDTEDVLYYPKYYAANRENPFGNPIEQDDIVTFKDIYLEAFTSQRNPVVREIKSANWDACISEVAEQTVDDINNPNSDKTFENTVKPMIDYVLGKEEG